MPKNQPLSPADSADVEEFLEGLALEMNTPFLKFDRLSGPCEDDAVVVAPWLMGVFADEDGMPCLAPDFRRHPHDL